MYKLNNFYVIDNVDDIKDIITIIQKKLIKNNKNFDLFYGEKLVYNSLLNVFYDLTIYEKYNLVFLQYSTEYINKQKNKKINDFIKDENISKYLLMNETEFDIIKEIIDNKYNNNNKEILKLAINKFPHIIEFASKILKNDKTLVIYCISLDGLTLKFVSEILKNDKNVVLQAVKQNGLSLEFASNTLKNDKDVVLEAVKQNGLSIQFASNTLKKKSYIISEATKQNKLALETLKPMKKNRTQFSNFLFHNDNDKNSCCIII